jgi:hypothetical protein
MKAGPTPSEARLWSALVNGKLGVSFRRQAVIGGVDETGPASYDIQGLWGSGPDEVWAAAGGGDVLGGAGQILHWDGTGWELYYAMGTPGLTDVWGVNGGASVFFVGHGPQFYELTSTTISLLEGQTGGSAVPNHGVWGSAPDAVWVASNSSSNPLRLWTGEEFADDSLYRSPHLSGVTAVWGSGPNDVWAADDEGILHFDGARWTQSYATTSTYFGIHGSGPGDVWAVGPRDLVHFDGEVWRVQTGGANLALNDVWVAEPNDVWLVGEGGRILHGGTAGFTVVESGITESLFSVWGTSPTDIWAGGENGVLIHYGPTTEPTMPPDAGTEECSAQGFGCSMTPCCAPFRCTNIGGGLLACS